MILLRPKALPKRSMLALGSRESVVKPPLFFDGERAGGRQVKIELRDDALVILDGEEEWVWHWPDLREMPDQADAQEMVFNHVSATEARLVVYDMDVIAQIQARAPSRHIIKVPEGTTRRVAVWSGLAIGSALLIVFVIIPNLANVLARMVPVEREVALGQASMNQLEALFLREDGAGFCVAEPGKEALAKMEARVTEQIESPYEYTIRVYNSPMLNAFAVPGGNIVFFDGLLKAAKSPEQVAGVLAHEIAHIENRDSLRLMLRAAGSAGILSMLIGDFAGGAIILIVTEQMVSANHSQKAEALADRFATDRLAEAGLPSTDFADFFLDLNKQFGSSEDRRFDQLRSYLESHPDLGDRATKAREANTIEGEDFIPVLTEEEWDALRAICGTTTSTKAKSG